MEIYVKVFALSKIVQIKFHKNLTEQDKALTNKLKNDINKLSQLIDKQDLNNYIKKVIGLLTQINILTTHSHGRSKKKMLIK